MLICSVWSLSPGTLGISPTMCVDQRTVRHRASRLGSPWQPEDARERQGDQVNGFRPVSVTDNPVTRLAPGLLEGKKPAAGLLEVLGAQKDQIQQHGEDRPLLNIVATISRSKSTGIMVGAAQPVLLGQPFLPTS